MKRKKKVIISSSLHGLGESPVPASSIVVCLSIVFLVYLCLVFRMVDIYMPNYIIWELYASLQFP
jgi:hypothetical protein